MKRNEISEVNVEGSMNSVRLSHGLQVMGLD